MTINFEKIKNVVISTMLGFTMLWIPFALVFQVYCVVLQFSGNEDELRRISNELTVRLDGNFANNPKNQFYNGK